MREHFKYQCTEDPTFQAESALPVILFVLYMFLSGLVMLSLFVGAVIMSMTESMEQMKEEAEEKEKRRRKLKAMKKQSAEMKDPLAKRRNSEEAPFRGRIQHPSMDSRRSRFFRDKTP